MPHRRRAAVAVRKCQQRGRRRSGGLGNRSLRSANAEARIDHLGWRTLREHRREGDTQRYEKWLLLHELVTICVPICDCQAVGQAGSRRSLVVKRIGLRQGRHPPARRCAPEQCCTRSMVATTILAMRVADETLIAEAGRRLAAAAPNSEVILFGSHARGDAGPHSDVDFLVVEPEVADETEEAVRLHRTLRDLRLPVDVIVVSRDYADRWRDVRGGLVHAALSQGRVLVG